MSKMMIMMLAALGAELLFLLLGLLAVSWFRQGTARRRDAKAIRALVSRIKKAKAERTVLIEKFCSAGMKLSDEPLQQAKAAMLRAELCLLQRFAGIYQKRDAAAAARFDADLYAALEPYQSLRVGDDTDAADAETADQSEIEQLRAENDRLSEELKVTMETMSRMLNEYSAMFAGGATDEPAPIATAVAGAAAVAAMKSGEADREAAVLTPGIDQAGAEGPTEADDPAEVEVAFFEPDIADLEGVADLSAVDVEAEGVQVVEPEPPEIEIGTAEADIGEPDVLADIADPVEADPLDASVPLELSGNSDLAAVGESAAASAEPGDAAPMIDDEAEGLDAAVQTLDEGEVDLLVDEDSLFPADILPEDGEDLFDAVADEVAAARNPAGNTG